MQQNDSSPSNPPGQGYHPVTRWLHAVLVLGVIFQLTCAALMAHPDEKGSELGHLFMQAHRAGGLVVALIVIANLIWAALLRGNPRKRQLSVLFSLQHWRKALSIAENIPLMIWGKRALPEPGNALSLVFEMLGLLIMSAMAITGSIIWSLWEGPGSRVPYQAEVLMAAHGAIAILLFLYLTGHVSMAVLHARAGDRVFARILPFGQKR